jgi:hypothetical protein
MDSILFSGCSYTYGEGLWRETGDTHQNSQNQKYLLENRWTTKVSNYFNLNQISKGYNGGSNIGSIKFVKEELDAASWNGNNIKLIIFQTTQFARNEESIDEQITEFEKLVEEVESKNIPIRFIHWQWIDLTKEEIDFFLSKNSSYFGKLTPTFFPFDANRKKHIYPPEDGNKLCSEIIRNKTIYILDEFNFQQMVNHGEAHKSGTLSNKYTLAGKLNCTDYHMNQEGHDILTNTIINYIEENKLL